MSKLKTECYNILLQSIRDSRPLSPDECETLLKYFEPAPQPVPKTSLNWLKKVKTSLLVVSNGKMYASDGRRIHAIKCDMKDGYYDPKSLEPRDNEGYQPDIPGSFLKHMQSMGKKPARFIGMVIIGQHYYQCHLDEALYRNDWVMEAVSGLEEEQWITRANVLVGRHKHGEYVVMPYYS